MHRRGTWLAGAVIAAAFVVINLDIARRVGIQPAGDTSRYTTGASRLLHGEGLDSRQLIYVGYIAIVAFADWSTVGHNGLIVLQLLLAAVAAVSLFDLGRDLGGRWVGLAAAALYITSPDFTRFTGWHSFILPDSTYTSGLAISLWAIHKAAVRRGHWFTLASLLVLFAASLRPQGWFLIPVAAIYWLAPRVPSGLRRWTLAGAVCSMFVLAVVLAPGFSSNTGSANPANGLRSGLVIYGSRAWRISMPSETPSGATGWSDVGYYAVRHPFKSVEVALARIATEAAHIRPFYSSKRNVIIGAYLIPLYLLAAVGLVANRRVAAVRLAGAVVALHLALVSVFFADYDGRFLVHMLPVIGLLAALGGAAVGRRLVAIRMGRRRAA